VRENTREREYISGAKGKNRIHSVSFQLGTERLWQRENYLFSEELSSGIVGIQSL
jgi:hypothetical protein